MESLATYEDRRPVAAHLPPDIVIVTTTYLHIPSRAQFHPTFIDDPSARVVRIDNPSATFYRFLYSNVGRDYHWTDRFVWSDEQLRAHLSRPTTTLLYCMSRATQPVMSSLTPHRVSREPKSPISV